MRKLNLPFLAILLVGLALLGGGMHLVHGFQVRRNASALLDRARQAEADQKPADAEQALNWYLSLRPDDGPTWAWYARLLDRQDAGRRGLERTYLVYQQALRREPGDRELKRRAADLAMELGRHGDARDLLNELLEGVATDTAASPPQGGASGEPATDPAGRDARTTGGADPVASRCAELEDLLGQCEAALGRHAEAEAWYTRAIGHDPHRVDAYDRLARLRRKGLRHDKAADAAIAEMVARNPRSGRALAYRWRYAHELAPPADDKDVARALELDPNDREVLLAAARAAERRRDMAAVRTYLAKGHERDPKDLDFATSLSQLERQEGHLDRAEAVLRRSFEARPVTGLAFLLADTLILEGKIDGKDGAEDLIGRLRRAGLGDTLVRFLEAEALFQRKEWTEAIAEIETARAVLTAAPDLVLRLNLMLAECHGRLGADEQRLEALRRAADERTGAETARLELVRVLAQSGRLDQAIETLSPLAIGGTNPAWRLDLVRLLLQKTVRLPRDRRDWRELERHLRDVEKAMTATAEPVVLLRLDVLAAQDRLDEARALLSESLAREPRNLGYRLAMARVAQLQHRDDEALKIIDQAEKDLGPSVRIDLARLNYWGDRGDDAARAAVANLAAARGRVPDADRPAYLDRLGAVAARLGRPDLARQYWHELATLRPEDLPIRLRLFDLALSGGDRDEPGRLIEEIRKLEGEAGINWRFARAALLIDQARRGSSGALEDARRLAADIAERRPDWWVAPTLDGEIAELAGSADQAISYYLRALELGNVQPSFARRLVTLLDQQGRQAEVARVTRVLKDQGVALAEVTLVQALDAIRRRDYDRGIALARQVFPDNSPNAADHLNLGRIYQAAGRADEAGREFRRAVERGAGVPEHWLAYVQYLVQARQLDQARAVIEAAGKALPPDRATLTLARCALLLGDGARAEALVKQAMAAPGKADDLATLRVAADVSLRMKRHDDARSYLDRIAASPAATPADQAWANRTRGTLWLATNRAADRDRALELVDRNLAADPESAEDQALRAAILALRPDRRGEAIVILERLAGANRLGNDQRFLLAQLHLGQGDAAKYEGEMLGFLNRKEKDPRHLAHFINHWIDRNQPDQAERWLAELKQADPRGRPALELEARLLDAKKQRPELLALLETREREVPDEIGVVADMLNRYGFTREAEAAYRAFVARDPGQPERGLALARFLALQDRTAEAMTLLERTWTTCSPDRVAPIALALYGARSASEPQKGRIVAWLSQVVKERPDAVALASNLGVIYMKQGRFADAEEILTKARTHAPRDIQVLNCLAWLMAMKDEGKAGEALSAINQAIEVQGQSSTLLDTRAVVLIRSGQAEKALEDLREARRLNPSNPNHVVHQAWAYQVTGRADEARKTLLQAKELGWTVSRCDPLERKALARWGKDLMQ